MASMRTASRALEPDLARPLPPRAVLCRTRRISIRAARSPVAGATLPSAAVRDPLRRRSGTRQRPDADLIVDCRGLAARDVLPDLRGVRGEMRRGPLARGDAVAAGAAAASALSRSTSCRAATALFMIGATVIESEERGPVSVRSALDLLSAAYALHPGFGEAEIVSWAPTLRPAFPDNRPRIIAAKALYLRQRSLPARLPARAGAGRAGRGYRRPGANDPEVFVADHSLNGERIATDAGTLRRALRRAGLRRREDRHRASTAASSPRRARATTALADGDEIEIVAPRQGG